MVSNSDYDGSGETPEIAALATEAEHSLPPSFSVGASLREGRERLGKDLAQVATSLRIRQPFLAALEEGRFKDLPGGTYAIGFLRTYAEFLGLDGEEMVRRFRQEAADALTVHAELQFPSPVTEGRMPSAPILLTGLSIAVVAYGLWWGIVYSRDNAGALIPAVPERLSNLLKRPVGGEAGDAKPAASDAATAPTTGDAAPASGGDGSVNNAQDASSPQQQAENPAPVVEDTKPAADVVPPSEEDNSSKSAPSVAAPSVGGNDAGAVASGAGRVTIKAISDECWIQVRESDGQLVVSRLLRVGDTYTVPDRPGLTLTAGNAGSLQITVDGKNAPPLGGFKQVKRDVSLDPAKLMKKAKTEASPAPTAQ